MKEARFPGIFLIVTHCREPGHVHYPWVVFIGGGRSVDAAVANHRCRWAWEENAESMNRSEARGAEWRLYFSAAPITAAEERKRVLAALELQMDVWRRHSCQSCAGERPGYRRYPFPFGRTTITSTGKAIADLAPGFVMPAGGMH